MSKEVGKLQLMLIVFVLVLVAITVLNLPTSFINVASQIFTILFLGAVASLVSGQLVEAVTGNFLKTIAINIQILGLNFSITAFAIAAFVVKTLLFRW